MIRLLNAAEHVIESGSWQKLIGNRRRRLRSAEHMCDIVAARSGTNPRACRIKRHFHTHVPKICWLGCFSFFFFCVGWLVGARVMRFTMIRKCGPDEQDVHRRAQVCSLSHVLTILYINVSVSVCVMFATPRFAEDTKRRNTHTHACTL